MMVVKSMKGIGRIVKKKLQDRKKVAPAFIPLGIWGILFVSEGIPETPGKE